MRDQALRFVRSARWPGVRRYGPARRRAHRDLPRVDHRRGQRPVVHDLSEHLRPVAELTRRGRRRRRPARARRPRWRWRLSADLVERIAVLHELGLGYLSLGRRSTTLSPGEAQRLRIATQLRSGLFGVVYVLDEPSAGCTGRRRAAARRPRRAQSARATRSSSSSTTSTSCAAPTGVVDIGPGAGEQGGRVLTPGGRRPRGGGGVGDGRAPLRPRRGDAAARPHATGLAAPAWGEPPQPRRALGRRAALRLTAVTGVSGRASPRSSRRCSPSSCAATSGQAPDDADETELEIRRRRRDRARVVRPPRARRPAPDRPHAAIQPRHLHRPLRRVAQAVCRHTRGA